MATKLNCRCDNCGRTAESVEIKNITIQNHVGQLCLACAHVLTLPKNEARFLQLVRKKGSKESNKEMQKVHQLMSLLLAIGTLFFVLIAVAGVSQGFNNVSWTSTEGDDEKETEYVSFVEINNYR